MKTLACLLLLTSIAAAKPVVIPDGWLVSTFQKNLILLAESGEHTTADAFAASLAKTPASAEVPNLAEHSPKDPDKAVYLLSTVYKCTKCEHWHPGGIATAWALTQDGVMVTNYHVIESAEGAVMAVCNRAGKTFPVLELLAADKAADIAMFRVETNDLTPLALGTPAEVGSDIQVISHPENRFYMHTFGKVGRYHLASTRSDTKSVVWMTITADFAKGSSGGPVLNSDNRVIGMVSNTQSIYFDSFTDEEPKGPFQMAIKDCVPVSAIKAMLKPKPTAGEDEATAKPASEKAAGEKPAPEKVTAP